MARQTSTAVVACPGRRIACADLFRLGGLTAFGTARLHRCRTPRPRERPRLLRTGRPRRGDEIDKVVADWVAQQPLAAFEAGGCAVARVYDAEALLNDPHLATRGTFPVFNDPDLGPIRVQAPTARLSATPATVRRLGPPLGADNDRVYGDLLGIDATRRAELRASGTI